MKKWLKLFGKRDKKAVSEQNLNTGVKSDEKVKATDEPELMQKEKNIHANKEEKKKNSTSKFIAELVFSVLLLVSICALRTVHLYANNVELVKFSDLGKDLWIYMGVSIAVFAILRVFLRKPYFACLITAFATFFAVNFNLLIDFMRLFVNKYLHASIGGIILFAVLVTGFIFLIRFIYKKKLSVSVITKILAATFAGLVLFNVVMASVALNKVASAQEAQEIVTVTPQPTVQATPEPTEAVATPQPTPQQTVEATPQVFGLPNIYFFILDEYSSFDMMEKYYGYGNRAFDTFLTTNGFNVIRESYVTDNQTGHSITDTLNLEYISRRLSSSECLSRINDAPFFTALSDLGYSQFQMSTSNKYFRGILSLRSEEGEEALENIVNMFGDEEAGDIVSESSISEALSGLFEPDADAIMYEDPDGINEWGFYPSDVIRETDRYKDHKYKTYINTLLKVFEYYEDPDNYVSTTPKATYTYMTAAHVPFVFNEYGNVLSYSQSRNWENEDVYLGQYRFITKHLTASISTIIENDPDSIIIIMSDHGIRYHADCGKKHTFYITDKDSCRIMNAVYIKGEQYDMEGLSAINTLRYVLSLYDGLDYLPIEDPITSDSPDSLRGIIPKPR